MDLSRLPAFTRTTTFRLALVHTALFIFFAGALLFYLFSATAGRLERDDSDALNSEVNALTAAYTSGGFSRLSQSVSERSSARASFLYLLVDSEGKKVAGDFDFLPAEAPNAGEIYVPFSYDSRNYAGVVQRNRAEGRIKTFPDSTVLLVAYDIGARREMVRRITDVVWAAAIAGLVLSLVGGIIVSRSVSRRVEALARTTEDVMAGDLSRRATVYGSGDEFDRLAERLNAMLTKLERLMVASRHSGDAIAHDLRSPLARLRNHLEVSLAQTGDRQDFEGAIAYSIEEVDRVLETFNAILRLSKVQGGQSGTFDKFNLSDQVAEIAEIYDAVCEEADLSFSADVKSNLMLLADKSLIMQLMFNLMDNAVKYTPAGGVVKLVLRRRRNGEIELSVLDSGPGISVENREKVLERFFRLEEARTEPGSGLGLSLVAAVAEMHQGKLQLSDGIPGHPTPGLKVSLTLASA